MGVVSILFFNNIYGVISSIFFYYYFQKDVETFLNEKRKEKLRTEFEEVLYNISTSVSSGNTLINGLEKSLESLENLYTNSYLKEEINNILKQIEKINGRDVQLLEDLGKRSGIEEIEEFVYSYKNLKRTGGNLNIAICRCISILRGKLEVDKEIKSYLKNKKLEGRIIASMPFIIIVFLRVSSPEYLEPMYSTLFGKFLMIISLILIGISLRLEERIISIEI